MESFLYFIFGSIFGWFVNYWYAIRLRRPKLSINGGGTGGIPNNPDVTVISINVQNEPRFIGLRLPPTYIFGLRVKSDFGRHFVERDIARSCRAMLLDKSGQHICHLWWSVNNNGGVDICENIDISSTQSASILMFIKKGQNKNQYFVYQPKSNEDTSHKATNIPTFKSTKEFKLKIYYGYGGTQTLEYPILMRKNYDHGFTFETPTGSSSL